MDASADRITAAILGAPQGDTVVLAAHNGPTSLGAQQHDICGADFQPRGGKHSFLRS